MNATEVKDLIKDFVLVEGYHVKSLRWQRPKLWDKGKGAVILIPGYGGTFSFFTNIGNYLNDLGWKVKLFAGFKSLEKIDVLAKKLAQEIINSEENQLVLLAHSKGGLVAKKMMDDYEEANKKVKMAICFSTPWKGSIIGQLRVMNLEEMRPNDSLIKEIAKKNKNNKKIISFYSKVDDRVLPNKNLLLEGARNIRIEIVGHSRILESKQAWEELGRTMRYD